MENTNISKTEEMLRDEITKAEKQIALQKMVLKEIEKKRTMAAPFITTKVGRVINSTLATLTKPFADLHKYSSAASNDPEKLIKNKDINKAQDIIEECAKIESRGSKGAREAALKAAHMKMYLDKYNPQAGDDIYPISRALHEAVNRLRPNPPNPEIQAKVKETLGVLSNHESSSS